MKQNARAILETSKLRELANLKENLTKCNKIVDFYDKLSKNTNSLSRYEGKAITGHLVNAMNKCFEGTDLGIIKYNKQEVEISLYYYAPNLTYLKQLRNICENGLFNMFNYEREIFTSLEYAKNAVIRTQNEIDNIEKKYDNIEKVAIVMSVHNITINEFEILKTII